HLGAEEEGIPHPIHTELATTENSRRLQAVADLGKGIRKAGVTKATAKLAADIPACPVYAARIIGVRIIPRPSGVRWIGRFIVNDRHARQPQHKHCTQTHFVPSPHALSYN